MTPISHLKYLNACREAVDWVKSTKCHSLEAAWKKCERADWMLWYAGRKAGPVGSKSRTGLVLIACECAELVLPIFEKEYPNDNRPRKAIKAARAYALNPCEKTAYAAGNAADAVADAADAVADAADAAADAADAADAAAAAADAVADAADAADAAADAAAAAADAADAAGRKDIQAKFCKIVRKYFPTLPKK